MDLLKEKEWEDMKFKIDVIYSFVNDELSLLKEYKKENLELHESVDELHEQISRWAAKVKKLESQLEVANEVLKPKTKEN